MKALVFQKGSLRFDADYPVPRAHDGEALVRVTLAGICATDIEIVKGYMGYEGVLGHEFVGVVEESGNSGLNGRRVAGEINVGCGDCGYCRSGLARHCPSRSVLGIVGRSGAFADYLTLPETNLHLVPDDVSDEEAIFIEPLAAAFEIAEQIDVGPGKSVCVLGDGRLGLLVAQVMSLQADSLLVIGRHPEKLAILEAQGIATALAREDENAADAAADGKSAAGKRDAAHESATGHENRVFDIVVDCTGSPAGIQQAMALVKPRGTIVLKTTVTGERPVDLNQVVIDEITLLGSRCGPFEPAIESLTSGKVDVKPLISRKFRLEEGLEAFEYAGGDGIIKVLLEI